jgi:hypothetical protein
MVQKKKQEEQGTPFIRRACRALGKIMIGLAVLAIVSPFLYSMYQQATQERQMAQEHQQ